MPSFSSGKRGFLPAFCLERRTIDGSGRHLRLAMDFTGYEYLDRGIYLGDNDRANLDAWDPGPVVLVMPRNMEYFR